MKKLELLINEFKNIKKGNFLKFIIIEMFILLIILGSLIVPMGSYEFRVSIIFLLLVVFFLQIILYLKKRQTIEYCKEQYQSKPSKVIEKLESRKTRYSDIFDFTNEALLFKEIIRVLKTKNHYREKQSIGPWEIIYDHQKTKRFSQAISLEGKEELLKASKSIEQLPEGVKTILTNFGIDYHNIYRIWKKRIGNKYGETELMYPVFGMILNDSQVLRHGLMNKQYRIDDTIIKVYENKVNNQDVVMLHVKKQFN